MNNLNRSAKNVLELGLLELISLRIGQINDSAYCIKMHYNELLALGDSELRLTLLYVWKEVPHFSFKERVVLQLVEDLCDRNKLEPSKKTFKMLRKHFNESEIEKLIISIQIINRWTWLMKTFGYDSERF